MKLVATDSFHVAHATSVTRPSNVHALNGLKALCQLPHEKVEYKYFGTVWEMVSLDDCTGVQSGTIC